MAIQPRTPHAAAIEIAMRRRGISQRDLGRILGMSQAAISRRLAGDPDFTITQARSIADALDTDLAELLQERAS
jgi:transcriptional regulator with XRE-family HTH domain